MEIKSNKAEYMSDFDYINELITYTDISKYKSKIKGKIEKLIRRSLDIIGGIVGGLTLLPLTAVVYIANLLSKEKGPLFYTQERIGKNGKIFKMYKYRSMVVGADEILKKYLEENEDARNEYKEYKKLKNDPRITKVGKFLRKTSLDEFPQFINVLKGEMSLVGPRPYLEREKEDMSFFFRYITSCKPGLTGYWQISGRSEVTFNDRLRMDMEYIKNNDLKEDIRIIGKTIEKIVKKEGAI